MTTSEQYYTGEGYEEDEPQEYEGNTVPLQPVPVYSLTENSAPEYGACMTWPIPVAGVNQPIQILGRRIRRSKGRVFLTSYTSSLSSPQNSPAAGSNFTYTVPAGGTAQILNSITALFTASAAVATRFVQLQIKDAAGNLVYQLSNGQGTVASTNVRITFATGITNANAATGTAAIAIPALVLQPGWTVNLIATSIDVADQFSGITMDLTQSATIIVNSNPNALSGSNPQGFTVPGGFTSGLEWNSQQPLYAIAIGIASSVSVIDESYAER